MTGLDAVYSQTLSRGSGLPGEAFTSEELFRHEAQRLFYRSWCCIGLTEDVSRPGQARPGELLGQPLLILRNANGVEVFHNLCSHRGALLVTEVVQLKRYIVCPYHSWTYSLDGKLARTPHAGGAGVHDDCGVDRNGSGLRRVRSATWHGLLFVNLSGDAAPFDQFIAPIEQRIGVPVASALRLDPTHSQSAVLNANWKLVIENFVESYHVPSVHRNLEAVNPMALHYQILGGRSYVGQGGNGEKWQQAGGEHDLPARPHGKVSQYEVFWVYPNLILGPIGYLCFVIMLFPKSAAVTHERLEFFFYGEEALAQRYAAERKRQVDFLVHINNEDIGICARTQAGRSSMGFSGGIFCSRQEHSSLRVQQIVAAEMLAGMDAAGSREFSFENIHHPEPARPSHSAPSHSAG